MHCSGKTCKVIIAAGLFAVVSTAHSIEPWASSFGSHSRYRLPEYLSGFSTVEKDQDDALEIARLQALDDLVRKVRVSVRSESVVQSKDDGARSSSSYTSLTRNSSELEVSEPDFLIDEDNERYYALAHVEVSALAASYSQTLEDGFSQFQRTKDRLEEQIEGGRLSAAESTLSEAHTLLEQLQMDHGVLRALHRIGRQAIREELTGSFEQFGDRINTELAALGELRGAVEQFSPETYEELVEYLATSIAPEEYELSAELPLRYRNSDFSSEFGYRLAHSVADRVRALGPDPDGEAEALNGVLEGTYWVDEEAEELEISLRVRRPETGKLLTGERIVVPMTVAGENNIVPDNAGGAMQNQYMLIGDATVEGNISVEAWTNKGRDQETLVFEQGEEVQFYFRVNQPAFLRITYELASGDLVLLEPSFYIGTDRVNRVVELPYAFVAVPPFGVERLIVTAYSEEPPPADTVIRTIDGQQYEVFSEAEDVVARTRGLARQDSNDDEDDSGGDSEAVSVGEASLTITTIDSGS